MSHAKYTFKRHQLRSPTYILSYNPGQLLCNMHTFTQAAIAQMYKSKTFFLFLVIFGLLVGCVKRSRKVQFIATSTIHHRSGSGDIRTGRRKVRRNKINPPILSRCKIISTACVNEKHKKPLFPLSWKNPRPTASSLRSQWSSCCQSLDGVYLNPNTPHFNTSLSTYAFPFSQ